jgi:hypothetical protein
VDLLISLASSQIFPLAWPGSFLGPCRRFPCEERACVWLGPRASVTVLSGDLIRFLAILDSLRKDFLSLNFFVSSAGLCSIFGRGLHRLPLSFSVFSARSHLFRARDLPAALLYRLIFRRPSLLSVSLPRARFLLLRSALLSFVPRPRGSDTGAALFLRSSC